MEGRSFLSQLSLVVSSILAAAAARGAEEPAPPASLAEVLVTAQKRTENLQDVPISVQTLDTQRLHELLATSFDDYVKYLPSIYSKTFGPSQEQPYIRGVTNATDGLHVGSQPTVAIYLDEQPVTTIANNLDVHIYDVARVEELSGPQGTLFGSSSMAGTLRIITNKPSTARFEAGYDLDANSVAAGGAGGKLEGYVNLPLSDRLAVRLVGFSEKDAGYINNVKGPPEVYPTSGVVRSNAGLTERHYNDVTTSGGRAALKADLADSWTVLPTVMGQRQTANGVDLYQPTLGDLDVATYFPVSNVDRWWQAALTVQGKISNLEIVYAAAYLNRSVDNHFDYSQYAYDYDVFYADKPEYFGDLFRDDSGHLISPAQYSLSSDGYSKVSHELRITTPQDRRLHFVGGLFLQHQVDDFRGQNRLDGLAATASITGYPGLLYLNAETRIDRDRAAFGELSYDLTKALRLTTGLREFGYDNTVYGFFGYNSTEALCEPGSAAIAGPGRPCINVDQRATGNGSTYKVSLSYRAASDWMLYTTWSTGFRPGGINRIREARPYDPDSLVNFEGGWKSEWLSHRVRLNGALFFERWRNPQFAICGPNCVVEVINAGGAEIRGLEAEMQWNGTAALTLSGSVTWLDAKLTANACVFGNGGTLCNNSTGVPDPTVLPVATTGSPLPVSKFRGNMVARYIFPVSELDGHAQLAATGQSSLPAALASANGGQQAGTSPGYVSFDLSGGIGRNGWVAELYVKNVLDRRGEQNRTVPCSLPTCNQVFVVPIVPRTIGVSFWQRF